MSLVVGFAIVVACGQAYEPVRPPPVPPSPVVTGVAWADKTSIVRAANDSDIWATTWADDGHLYTAYGDGTGFVPKVPVKLSQGLARIEGGPDGFRGLNVRSPTFERFGNGPKGPKASGLLMVDGVLYALVRNTENAQVIWSTDRGMTWAWANWKFQSGFGCPTFVNFGPNYSGARDAYVYIVSHDADTAYQVAERFVLARVPKDQIRNPDAYEYYAGSMADGGPAWSRQPSARAAILAPPNKCYRCTVSYNAGLKRYLLCQAGADRQSDVGLGIFDAPEPWGPWTVAYYARRWDVSPGESCCFPTKWMSADGKTLHLVFSGDDSFNVRRAVLTTTGGH
jgi:hypothetical protein